MGEIGQLEKHIVDLIDEFINWEGTIEMGGKGSGNWGHKGRKGKRGGSLPSKGKKSPPTGSKFNQGIIEEDNFTASQLYSLKQVVDNVPQEHLDIVLSVEQDYIGEWAAECSRYNRIVMGKSRGVGKNWQRADLLHEIGHAIEFDSDRSWTDVKRQNRPSKVFRGIYNKLAKKHGYEPSTLRAERMKNSKMKPLRGFPSSYSMSNPAELFASSYESYIRSPKSLQKQNSKIYNYMRDTIFDGVEYGD